MLRLFPCSLVLQSIHRASAVLCGSDWDCAKIDIVVADDISLGKTSWLLGEGELSNNLLANASLLRMKDSHRHQWVNKLTRQKKLKESHSTTRHKQEDRA